MSGLSDEKRELVLVTIGEVAGVKSGQVRMDSCLRDDLRLNHLERFELALELEARFSIDLSEDVIEAMGTVADVVKAVAEARHE